MAWPFTVPASAPTSFGGPGATLPTSLTSVDTNTDSIVGVYLINTGAVEHQVTITDTAGHVLYEFTMPGGSSLYDGPAFRPAVGIKWQVDAGTDVLGHIWGY